MKKKSGLYLSFLFITGAFVSCNNDTNSGKENMLNADDSIALVESTGPGISTHKFDMVISDIPFPFEILDNLYSKNVPFEQKAMNDVSNISKYNQYNSKALNLGIYGADLAYTVTYEEFQQMGAYVKNTKRLAEELNIPYAFNQEMMDKYSKFKDNKDSLTQVVYDSYNQVDQALKNDERVGMAALVVTGSWLEGLYLSTKAFIHAEKTPDNSSMYNVIMEQKQSLGIVIKLLEEYKKDTYIARLIDDLKGITSEYNVITSDETMNEKQLIIINSKVEALRSKIIEGL
ncbi:MAG TPA: hypothetical protein VGC65_03585 [Bacteroidia bacterium]|jgi:hypothetical protein